jgi:hypothetical protein
MQSRNQVVNPGVFDGPTVNSTDAVVRGRRGGWYFVEGRRRRG